MFDSAAQVREEIEPEDKTFLIETPILSDRFF